TNPRGPGGLWVIASSRRIVLGKTRSDRKRGLTTLACSFATVATNSGPGQIVCGQLPAIFVDNRSPGGLRRDGEIREGHTAHRIVRQLKVAAKSLSRKDI